MIESKFKFFSPLHRNLKLDFIVCIGILYVIFAVFMLDISFIIFSYAKILILLFLLVNYLFVLKVNDFYTILGKIKNNTKDFKKWLNFMKTNFYKNIVNLIYVYVFSIIYCIVSLIIYFIQNESYFNKTLSIIIICSLLLHTVSTFIKLKKIKP